MIKSSIGILVVIVTLSVMGSAVTSRAADLEPIVEERIAYDWSGIYFGAHIGYGGVDTSGEFDRDTRLNNDLDDFDAQGILGGGQLGWNWQAGNWVFGIEGDISAVDWDSSAPDLEFPPGKVILDFDFLATVRARIGWAMDNSLLYLTGGVAFLEGEFSDPEQGGSEDISAVGGAVGGGFEFGVTQNLSLKAEGLYLLFNDDTSLADLTTAAPSDSLEIEDGFVVRFGANLRL